LVERETCETAGDMEANLAGAGVAKPQRSFPPANWGPWAALIAVFAALAVGQVLAIPALFLGENSHGELSTAGDIVAQTATEFGFLLVPMALASMRGASGLRAILDRLGFRAFKRSAFG
jgi:hypothetical protein